MWINPIYLIAFNFHISKLKILVHQTNGAAIHLVWQQQYQAANIGWICHKNRMCAWQFWSMCTTTNSTLFWLFLMVNTFTLIIRSWRMSLVIHRIVSMMSTVVIFLSIFPDFYNGTNWIPKKESSVSSCLEQSMWQYWHHHPDSVVHKKVHKLKYCAV